jgi:tetratricopeptide (TPR) repeat protein
LRPCVRLGNEAFIAKKYDVAMKHYTKAIELDPENAVYYSNRR